MSNQNQANRHIVDVYAGMHDHLDAWTTEINWASTTGCRAIMNKAEGYRIACELLALDGLAAHAARVRDIAMQAIDNR